MMSSNRTLTTRKSWLCNIPIARSTILHPSRLSTHTKRIMIGFWTSRKRKWIGWMCVEPDINRRQTLQQYANWPTHSTSTLRDLMYFMRERYPPAHSNLSYTLCLTDWYALKDTIQKVRCMTYDFIHVQKSCWKTYHQYRLFSKCVVSVQHGKSGWRREIWYILYGRKVTLCAHLWCFSLTNLYVSENMTLHLKCMTYDFVYNQKIILKNFTCLLSLCVNNSTLKSGRRCIWCALQAWNQPYPTNKFPQSFLVKL